MTTQWAMTTGDNIGAELRRKRRTQADLGELLGLSQAAVSRKLRGKAPMTVDDLFTIAAWLDVPVTDLLPAGGEGVNTPTSGLLGEIPTDSLTDSPIPAADLLVAA